MKNKLKNNAIDVLVIKAIDIFIKNEAEIISIKKIKIKPLTTEKYNL